MNSQIAKKRIGDVIRVDTITSSQADFMATHVEVKNIQLTKSYEGNVEKMLTETQAFHQFVLNPNNQHQLILIVGLSGTGKSHLIRWFSEKLQRDHADNEVILFIRRSDNSLKGTIKQLLELDEVAQIPNKDVYERLVRATTVIDNKKLKDMIYQNFIVEIMNDENDDILAHNRKKRLVALLKNEAFQVRLMEDNKAIDRIYQKVAQSKTGDNRDVIPLFDANDFYVDAEFCEALIREEADRNARIMAKNLVGDEEYPNRVASYMNTLVNNVIQTCAGLEPGDFEQVFLEIRRELKKQGKALTLLIEDITAFTGVNVALLNVLTLENTGMYQDLCRISSIIGTTTYYFEDEFNANYRDRVTDYMRISDEAFGSDANSLCEFVGKYLNTMSLQKVVLEDWLENGGQDEEYPVHNVTEGIMWDYITTASGKKLNLFPFTKTSIGKLFSLLPEHQQTPRYLLRDVVERAVRNYLSAPKRFPSFRIDRLERFPWNPDNHRSRLMQFVKDEEYERMNVFIRIWGDANLYEKKDVEGNLYIGGIPVEVFDELQMEQITGLDGGNATVQTPVKSVPTEQGQGTDAKQKIHPKPVKDPGKIAFQLGIQIIAKWMQGGSLNFDSTKKDSKMMQQARDEMNRYIFNAMNWQIEGISLDNILKFTSRDFVEFERQSKKVGKSLVMLPASPETQSVLENFVAFVTLGEGKTWSFEDGPWRQYQVQLWFEKLKPLIIEKITTFNGLDVDYHECAMSAELIREIIFGQYKGTSIEGMSETLLWESSPSTRIPASSSHCKEWISLMTSMKADAERIQKNVIDYYNLIQGTGGKNKFLNHARLLADFKKVNKNLLIIDELIISEKDPFKPRQDIRGLFRDIQGKLKKVADSEVELANSKLDNLWTFIERADMDEEDVIEIADYAAEFYDAANKTQVNVRYEPELIESVRKSAKPVANAVNKVQKAVALSDSLDILMAFSQDPLIRVDKLLCILTKLATDMKFVQSDIEKRKSNVVKDTNESGSGRYATQKELIGNDLQIIEGWEG